MPLTGKAQLAAAQLDDLGSNDRGDKVVLSNTAQVLVDMAGYLIGEAQNNLNKSGSEATGELEASIKASDIDVQGKRMSIDISLLDRYKFTDAGVNGVEKSNGSPFSFKTKKPSVAMKTSIKKWLRLRGNRATKYKAISKVERKDKSLNKLRKQADSQESMAWAVATNIKKNGIKPTKFFSKAIAATEKEYRKQIATGFKMDIINNLK
jgi:hypothetical protein